MTRVTTLVLGFALVAAALAALAPPASAGHEDCDQHHYPQLERACLLANWWHWCLEQVWWSRPCLVLGSALP